MSSEGEKRAGKQQQEMEKPSEGSTKRKKKKQPSFADALAELDEFSIPKKTAAIKVYDQKKNCVTGLYEVKPRKVYERKNDRPRKQTSKFDGEATGSNEIEDSVHDHMDTSNDSGPEQSAHAEFLASLDEIQYSFPDRYQQKEWSKRQRSLNENWASSRDMLFSRLLLRKCIPEEQTKCGRCLTNVAVLRCLSCKYLLCGSCDDEIHENNQFHDREVWMDGSYKGICNNLTVIDDAIVTAERPVPACWPLLCPACDDDKYLTRTCLDSKVAVITTNGRFEFNDVLFRCTNCQIEFSGCTQKGMVMAGFWPSSPQKSATFFAENLLQLWEELSNNSPGTSLSSFIKSLEGVSKKAGRPSYINATSFGKSFREWLALKDSLRFQEGEDRFACPVCENKCHSIHIDGHRKTYRFKKVPRGNEESIYGDKFIAKDEEVQVHMKALYDKMGSQDYNDDKMCGASYWQAARSKSKANFGTLDETGLVVAGCRHVLALKAVNMFAGEQYGYALFLHKLLADSLNMSFVWQDIMCKYWPWLERVATKLPEFSSLLESSKALSVMHAKAHSLDCQLVWGGSYQNNAALSTGESMEQFFSYFAKCGLTTKNMNASARRDTLTEHTAFWNERKIDGLAASLAKQYKKVILPNS